MPKIVSKKTVESVEKLEVGEAPVVIKDEVTSEPVPELAHLTVEQVALIGVEASRTINLGDYNSMRVGVSIQLPTPVGALLEGYGTAKEWVDDRMCELLTEAGLLDDEDDENGEPE